jgi:anti-sigma factor RsiW
VTPEQARELFSAAYDQQLEAAEQRAFDAVLADNPELAQQYAAFRATFDVLQRERAALAATPDLLRGVQKRLRNKSGGRYYADRFAERSGWGLGKQFGLLVMLVVLLGLLWLATSVLQSVQMAP